MLKLSFDSKGHDVKNPTFYALDCLCNLTISMMKKLLVVFVFRFPQTDKK